MAPQPVYSCRPFSLKKYPSRRIQFHHHHHTHLQRKGFGDRGLNLSVSGAVAQDVPQMARQLVKMVIMMMIMVIMMMMMIMIVVVVMMVIVVSNVMVQSNVFCIDIS